MGAPAIAHRALDPPPAKRDFVALVQRARRAAKRAGMRRSDIANAVETARRSR